MLQEGGGFIQRHGWDDQWPEFWDLRVKTQSRFVLYVKSQISAAEIQEASDCSISAPGTIAELSIGEEQVLHGQQLTKSVVPLQIRSPSWKRHRSIQAWPCWSCPRVGYLTASFLIYYHLPCGVVFKLLRTAFITFPVSQIASVALSTLPGSNCWPQITSWHMAPSEELFITHTWITGHLLGWFKTLHMKPSISSASGWNDIRFTWKAAPSGWENMAGSSRYGSHKWYQVIVTVTPHKIGFFSKSLMTEKPMEESSKHQPPSLWSSSLNSDLKVAASSRSVASGYIWSANKIWSVLNRKWCLFGSSYAGLLEGAHICVIHTSIYLTYDGWICL